MLVTIKNISNADVAIPGWGTVIPGATRVFNKSQDEIDVVAEAILRFIKKGWIEVSTSLDADSAALNASPLAATGVVEGLYLTLVNGIDNSDPASGFLTKLKITPGFFRAKGLLFHVQGIEEQNNPYYVAEDGSLNSGSPVLPEGKQRGVCYIAYATLYGAQNQNSYTDILTVYGPEEDVGTTPSTYPTTAQLIAACVADYGSTPRDIVLLGQSTAWRNAGSGHSGLELRVRTFTR